MTNQKIVLLCILIFMTLVCNPAFSHRPDARRKSCHSNIGVIQGAIEMYNMDHSKMVEYYDSNTVKILEGYLKPVSRPEPDKCDYKSMGNLTKNGFIICTYHGDLEQLVYCEAFDRYSEKTYEKFNQNATDEEIEDNIEKIRKGKEDYYNRLKLKQELKYFSPLFVILAIILFLIISNIPSRKRTS